MRGVQIILLSSLSFSAALQLTARGPHQGARECFHLTSRDLPVNDREKILQGLGPSACSAGEVPSQLLSRVRDLGYLHAVVQSYASSQSATSSRREHSPTLERRATKNEPLNLTLNAGPRYVLGGLEIVGATALPAKQLHAAVRLAPGAVFAPSRLARGMDAIQALYARRGYLDEVTTPELRIDEQKHVIFVSLNVQQGTFTPRR